MLKLHEVWIAFPESATLGEGPLWDHRTSTLYWVDIGRNKLHRFDPATKDSVTWKLPGTATSVLLTGGKGVLLTLNNEVVAFDPETEARTPLAEVQAFHEEYRCNDAKVDHAGRLWVGFMHRQCLPGHGKLFCVNADRSVDQMLNSLTIPNGIGWSPDHRQMYFIDSVERALRVYNYDGGNIDLRTTIRLTESTAEVPDGLCVDREGMLWVAFYGGSRVARIHPETGEELIRVSVPAPHVTSCAFGGDDLRTLYITTARQELTSEQLEQFPLSGSLFACRTEVEGSLTSEFRT